MAETETCEGRIQFFHRCAPSFSTDSHSLCIQITDCEPIYPFRSTGIIRDVMANHLQLLLGLAVAPSFEHLTHADQERLAFAQSLSRAEAARDMLLLGQYEDYARHYRQETGTGLSESSSASLFVPTAARVTLQSSMSNWNATHLVLSAVKAAHERRLEVIIHFKASAQADADTSGSCELRVTIQTQKNVERRKSERIAWTCAFLDNLIPPSGWETEIESHSSPSQRVLVPSSSPISSSIGEMWRLGDARTAYDVLLREAATGNRKHFASMQEAVAAWELWTPIVQHAERATRQASPAPPAAAVSQPPAAASYTIYPTGSALWSRAQVTAASQSPRDEL